MLESILFAEFLGKAAWIWYAFVLAVIALLVFDLGVVNKTDREIGVRESLTMSASTSASASPSPGSSGCSTTTPRPGLPSIPSFWK